MYLKYAFFARVIKSFMIRNLLSVKDSIPRELRLLVVYKFVCTSCNSSYIGETSRHFSTRVREHLSPDFLKNHYQFAVITTP